jgi:hypothetical protein
MITVHILRCPRVTVGEEWQLEHGDRDKTHQMMTIDEMISHEFNKYYLVLSFFILLGWVRFYKAGHSGKYHKLVSCIR